MKHLKECTTFVKLSMTWLPLIVTRTFMFVMSDNSSNTVRRRIYQFKLCQTEVQFAGFKLTSEGYSVSLEIMDAIASFPSPSS